MFTFTLSAPLLPTFLAVAMVGWSLTAHAQEVSTPAVANPLVAETASTVSPVAPAGSATLTAADLEAFLDGVVPTQLQHNDTAGATVIVVKDGQVLLAKGYGFADYQARTPVSAEETLFRPGSISKLFTVTAVMQLVEAGKLDLDRDVNAYLDFAIPATFPEPVTLRRLLTHTAGFEETAAYLFVDDPAHNLSLRDYVLRLQPRRVFAPGSVSSYSNYGLALAGYIVERVSGEPFADYVAAHLFAPLHMEHSSFVQPLPAPLAAKVSNGYRSTADKPVPFEICPPSPAGGLSTTAADMARFMMAYLAEGSLDGAQILRPESVREVWRRQYETHPALNAMGLVFCQETGPGWPNIVAHGGATWTFFSYLFLIPEAKVGVFVSYNTRDEHPGRALAELRQAFLNRYFAGPVPAPAVVPAADARKDAADVAGQYQTTRRAESNFLKFGALLSQTTVAAQADGSLQVSGVDDLHGHPIRWQPVGGLVYREKDGRTSIAFRRDTQGRVAILAFNRAIFEATRAPWYESQTLVGPLVGIACALLLVTTLLWPVAAVARRYYGRPLVPEKGAVRVLFVLGRLACVLDVLVLASWAAFLSTLNTGTEALGDMHTPRLHVLYVLGWAAVGGTALLLTAAVALTRSNPPVRRWPKVHQWLLVAAGGVFAWFLWHWHFLGL